MDLINLISEINMDDNYFYVVYVLVIFIILILINLFQPYLKHKKILKKQRDKG